MEMEVPMRLAVTCRPFGHLGKHTKVKRHTVPFISHIDQYIQSLTLLQLYFLLTAWFLLQTMSLNLQNRVKYGFVIESSLKEKETSTSPSNKGFGNGDGSVSR